MSADNFYACYIDEKRFYGRNKEKHLPWETEKEVYNEEDEDDNDKGFYNDINLTTMDIELFGGDLCGGW